LRKFPTCCSSRKFKKDPAREISCAFIKGAIIKSLVTIFGEIGGQREFDLLKFDDERKKGIIRVPADSAVKLCVALTFISEFQGTPAVFQVNQTTNNLPALVSTFVEF
jgi:RNase P/RNase MRP subunit POP5